MKRLMIAVVTAMMAVGCTQRVAAPPRVQISDSPIYISVKPIQTGRPVTFWYELDTTRKALVAASLSNRFGDPQVTVSQPEGDEISMGKVSVSNVIVIRTVTVKQGETTLFEKKEDVTPQTMDDLSTWTISSDEWLPAALTAEDVTFAVDYWRSYESALANGGHSIAGDVVMIPVEKPRK